MVNTWSKHHSGSLVKTQLQRTDSFTDNIILSALSRQHDVKTQAIQMNYVINADRLECSRRHSGVTDQMVVSSGMKASDGRHTPHSRAADEMRRQVHFVLLSARVTSLQSQLHTLTYLSQ